MMNDENYDIVEDVFADMDEHPKKYIYFITQK